MTATRPKTTTLGRALADHIDQSALHQIGTYCKSIVAADYDSIAQEEHKAFEDLEAAIWAFIDIQTPSASKEEGA